MQGTSPAGLLGPPSSRFAHPLSLFCSHGAPTTRTTHRKISKGQACEGPGVGPRRPRCPVNPLATPPRPSASPRPPPSRRAGALQDHVETSRMLTHKYGSSFKKPLQTRQGPRLPSPTDVIKQSPARACCRLH